MANIVATKADVSEKGDGSTYRFIWTPVTENDVCVEIRVPQFADRAFQAAGTFGGATVRVTGSIDETNYASLNDPSGSAIALTSAAVKQVLENSVLIKPTTTGGTGQSLTLSMLCKLSNPLRT